MSGTLFVSFQKPGHYPPKWRWLWFMTQSPLIRSHADTSDCVAVMTNHHFFLVLINISQLTSWSGDPPPRGFGRQPTVMHSQQIRTWPQSRWFCLGMCWISCEHQLREAVSAWRAGEIMSAWLNTNCVFIKHIVRRVYRTKCSCIISSLVSFSDGTIKRLCRKSKWNTNKDSAAVNTTVTLRWGWDNLIKRVVRIKHPLNDLFLNFNLIFPQHIPADLCLQVNSFTTDGGSLPFLSTIYFDSNWFNSSAFNCKHYHFH